MSQSFLPPANWEAKIMFSVVSVYLFTGGFHHKRPQPCSPLYSTLVLPPCTESRPLDMFKHVLDLEPHCTAPLPLLTCQEAGGCYSTEMLSCFTSKTKNFSLLFRVKTSHHIMFSYSDNGWNWMFDIHTLTCPKLRLRAVINYRPQTKFGAS